MGVQNSEQQFSPRSLKLILYASRFKDTAAYCHALHRLLSRLTRACCPNRVTEGGRKTENPERVYLFAVSAVIAVVWIDPCPWRYGEQHFSRRYVRSGEYSPGCQLTSAAREVKLGIRGSDASPVAASAAAAAKQRVLTRLGPSAKTNCASRGY